MKLLFSINNFQETLILKDSRLVPQPDFSFDFDTNFNGQNFKIQSVYYDSYKITCYVRESLYQRLQKIRYANNIVVQDENTYNCEFIDFKENQAVNEIREIEIFLYDKNSKKTELIENTNTGNIAVYDTLPQAIDINLPFVYDNEFKQSVVSNFDEQIKDYNKVEQNVNIRFFLQQNYVFDFLKDLAKVTNYNIGYKIRFNDLQNSVIITDIRDFEVKNTPFGINLIQIDLILKYKNYIKTLWTAEIAPEN